MIKKIKSRFLQTLKSNKAVLLTVIILVVLGDILLIPKSSDYRFFGILGLYIASIFLYTLKSKFTFSFCLFLLGVMFFEFLLSEASDKTERAAVWLVLFLGVGIVQQWRE